MALGAMRSFVDHYTQFHTRILFRWVDLQKHHLIRRIVGERTDLNILDLGCGTGELSKPYTRSSRVYGVDRDLSVLKYAKANGLITHCGLVETLSFDDETFDVVLMVDSIEHTESRERAFSEVKRTLKKGGIFLAITPCYSSFLWVLGEKLANLITTNKESGHISPFNLESISHFMNIHFSDHEVGSLNFGMWLYGIGRNMPSSR